MLRAMEPQKSDFVHLFGQGQLASPRSHRKQSLRLWLMRGRSRLVVGGLAMTMLILRCEIGRAPLGIFHYLQPAPCAAAEDPPAPTPASPRNGRQPDLWVLAVGVSNYQDNKLNLRFADSDAAAVAAALGEQRHRRVYDEIHSLVLTN